MPEKNSASIISHQQSQTENYIDKLYDDAVKNELKREILLE